MKKATSLRLLSLVLCICMVLGLMPGLPVSAEDTPEVLYGTKDNLDKSGTLAEAVIAYRQDPSVNYIQLQRDITAVSGYTVQNVTLDLNGHSITADPAATITVLLNAYGTVTLTDTSEAKTGSVTVSNSTVIATGTSTVLTIEAGTYCSNSIYPSHYVLDNDGTTVIKPGVTLTVGNSSEYIVSNWGTLTVEGGSFRNGYSSIWTYSGSNTVIAGGDFQGYNVAPLLYQGGTVDFSQMGDALNGFEIRGYTTAPASNFTLPADYYLLNYSGTQATEITSIAKNYRIEKMTACKLSFNANGGTGTMEPMDILAGAMVELPECGFTAPAGKFFVGWTNERGTFYFAGEYAQFDGDSIVTAVWGAPIDITFDANGGTGTMAPIEDVPAFIYLPECEFTHPEGLEFVGWGTDPEGSKIYYPDCFFFYLEDVTLYALWEGQYVPRFDIDFDANGGTGTMDPLEKVSIEEGTVLPECTFTAPAGKVFVGWCIDPNGDYIIFAPGEEFSYVIDCKLYAIWADSTTITFDANGGTGTMEPVTFPGVMGVTLPLCGFTAPEGMAFMGWSMDPQGAAEYRVGDWYYGEYDVTFYAIWGEPSVYVADIVLYAGEYLDLEGNVSTSKPEGGYAYYDGAKLVLNSFVWEESCTYAIYSSYDLIIELVGISGFAAEYGVECSSLLTITGQGTLNLTGCYGLYANLGFIITGGTFNISSDSVAIWSSSDFSVSNSTINIVSGEEAFYCYGEISISKSTINVDSEDDGFYSSYEDIIISDSKINIVNAEEGIQSYENVTISDSTITMSDVYCGIYSERKATISGSVIIIGGENCVDGIDNYGVLEISNSSVDVYGIEYGIYAYELYLKGVKTKLTASCDPEYGYNPVLAYDGISMSDGLKLTSPVDGYFDDSAFRCVDGSWAISVTIEAEGVAINSGWTEIDGNWYYYDPDTNEPVTGVVRVPYPSEVIDGITYAPDQETIDYAASKDVPFIDEATGLFIFDENGVFQSGLNGMTDDNRWAVNGHIAWHPGLVQIGEDYYYFTGDSEQGGNKLATGDVYVSRNTTDFDMVVGGVYTFDEDGKLCMYNGVAEVNGVLRYYENAKLTPNKGLIAYGDGYIYVRSNGKLALGEYYITNVSNDESGLFAAGMKVDFGSNGIATAPKNGVIDGYYYEGGKVACNKGLIAYNGGWIYVRSNGKVATGTYWITNTNGAMAQGCYEFGADGMMIVSEGKDGIVEENGVLYYYQNGTKAYGAGLIQLDANSYIYVRSNGQLAVGKYWPTTRNGYLEIGEYDFGEDGILTIN